MVTEDSLASGEWRRFLAECEPLLLHLVKLRKKAVILFTRLRSLTGLEETP